MNPEDLIPLRLSGPVPGPVPGPGPVPAPFNYIFGPDASDRKAITVVTNAQWPSLRLGRAVAGPTGDPWINANGWRIQMLRARDRKPVWLDTKPASPNVELAAAEAEVYGGRWVATADPNTFPKIQQAIAFFESHKHWRTWRPVAKLAVVSDFAGPNEFPAGEYLNLLSRRQIPYQLNGNPESAQAIVLFDHKPVQIEAYTRWVRAGGLLIVPPDPRKGSAPIEHGHKIFAEGKGRIAVAERPWSDPYQTAAQTHLLLSRRHDTLRLWNAGPVNAHYVESPDQKTAVVHLLNYANRPSTDNTTLWTAKPYQSATLQTLSGQQSTLRPVPVNGGTELALPPLGPYTAIELTA